MFSILFFLISTISVLSLDDSKCFRLPNGCKLESDYCKESSNMSKCHFYVCEKLQATFKFDQTQMNLIRKCTESANKEVRNALNDVYFRLSKSSSSILDSSFDLLNNELFLNEAKETYLNLISIFEIASSTINRIRFRFLKGFDITETVEKNISLQLEFYYSKLDFYLNRILVQSCDDLISGKHFSHSYEKDARFYYCEYNTKICPLGFLHLGIGRLRFYGIQNTFYRSNYPKFIPMNNTFEFMNYSSPFLLDLIDMQNIELTSTILDRTVFKDLFTLRLFGDIKSIQSGLLKSFRSLKIIHLDTKSIKRLFHNGIDWMFDLNPDIQLDLNHISMMNIHEFERLDLCVTIFLYTYYTQGSKLQIEFEIKYVFPDQDFCLYTKYPFQKLVVLLANFFDSKFTCTFAWIIQYHILFNQICHSSVIPSLEGLVFRQLENLNEKIAVCNFSHR